MSYQTFHILLWKCEKIVVKLFWLAGAKLVWTWQNEPLLYHSVTLLIWKDFYYI